MPFPCRCPALALPCFCHCFALPHISKFIESIKDDSYEIRVIGKKGTSFVSKLNNEYESFKVSDMPTFEEVSPITGNISSDINSNGFSKVFILYTEFISTAVQKPKIKQLLPIELDINDSERSNNEFLYELGSGVGRC